MLAIVLIFFLVKDMAFKDKIKVKDNLVSSGHVGEIDNNNYTDVLKAVHENLDTYLRPRN